jgi:transketolase
MRQVLSTLNEARHHRGSPVAIVAHTVKGKGVSFMENRYEWHTRVPNVEELRIALAELGESDPVAAQGGAS